MIWHKLEFYDFNLLTYGTKTIHSYEFYTKCNIIINYLYLI